MSANGNDASEPLLSHHSPRQGHGIHPYTPSLGGSSARSHNNAGRQSFSLEDSEVNVDMSATARHRQMRRKRQAHHARMLSSRVLPAPLAVLAHQHSTRSDSITANLDSGYAFDDLDPPFVPGITESVSSQRLPPSDRADGGDDKDSPYSSFENFMAFLKQRSPYYIPIVRWMPLYNQKLFVADVMAGVSMGVATIPIAIAYAALAGRPPVSALLSCFFAPLVYCVMGGSMQMNVGPDALISSLTGNFVADAITNSDGSSSDYTSVLTLLVGLFLLAMGALRLGFIESVLNRAVIEALVMAVATEVCVGQLRTLFGHEPCHTDCAGATAFTALRSFLSNLHQTQWRAVLISIFSISFLVVSKWLKAKYAAARPWLLFVPQHVLLVIFFAVVSYAADLKRDGVHTLGSQTGGFDRPASPPLNSSFFNDMSGPALNVCVLLFVESYVAARQYATKYSYTVSPNRELVALGLVNFIGSFFGAFPVGASLARSKLNDDLGAKTPVAGVVSASVIMFAILFLLPSFATLPKPVIASIVVVAVAGLFDFHEILFAWRIRAYIDLGLFFSMYILTALFGVENSIIFAAMACLGLLVKHSAVNHPEVVVLGCTRTGRFVELQYHDDARTVDGVLLLRLSGALHFVNASRIADLFQRVEMFGSVFTHPSEDARTDSIRGSCFILDFEYVSTIDSSALQTLLLIFKRLHATEVVVHLVGVRTNVHALMVSAGVIELVGEANVHPNVTLEDEAPRIIAEVQAQAQLKMKDMGSKSLSPSLRSQRPDVAYSMIIHE